MTPHEYTVRVVRAWVTNLDLNTVPELQAVDDEHPAGVKVTRRREQFVEQVLNVAQEIVGPLAYAIITERQDEEWQRFRHEMMKGRLTEEPYPVRFITNGEIVR